jgi:hypothetical protein
MQQGALLLDVGLASVLERIIHLISSFSTLRFYHVLRDNNPEVDMYVSVATRKNEGILIINNEVIIEPVP